MKIINWKKLNYLYLKLRVLILFGLFGLLLLISKTNFYEILSFWLAQTFFSLSSLKFSYILVEISRKMGGFHQKAIGLIKKGFG